MRTVLLELDRSAAPADADPIANAAAFERRPLQHAANLGAAFVEVARSRPAHAALVTKDAIYTYAWLRHAAESVSRFLKGRPGYQPGERVALQLANSPEYVAAYYGVLLADGVVMPLPVPLEASRRDQVVALCRPSVLLSRRGDIGEGDASGATALRLDGEGELSPPAPRRERQDVAMLLLTSGSTGTSKAVMLSHGNLLSNADSILQILPIKADDRALVVIPFCHAFGNSVLHTHVLAGATLLLHGPLIFPAAIVGALRDLQATSFSAVPEVYNMLLKFGGLRGRPLPALRYMSVAGGELRNESALQLADSIEPASFHMMYGQSEASARLAVLAPHDLKRRPGSIGKPIPNVELTVRNDDGSESADGEVGMLCARGPNVMLGYWDDPVSTAEVLDRDGWLRTGDLAHRDADGAFYLHGRANLLTKVQGHRVHPAEIESVVENAFPHARAAATPVARGDDMRFVLFLAPRDNRPIDVAKVRALCQRELPPYKVPVRFEMLERLPLTTGFKIDRAALSRLVTPSSVA